MPSPPDSDIDAKRSALQSWLAARMPSAKDVTVAKIAPTGGLSHEILNLDVQWREDGREHHRGMMVRFDPVQYRKRRISNLRREFEVQSILSRRGDVPVPKVFWYEEDESLFGAAFYAMARIEGRVPLDKPPYQREGWVKDLPPEDRAQVWRSAVTTMARLHAAPAAAFTTLRRGSPDIDVFDEHVRYWHDHYQWATEGQTDPVADAAWRWVIDNPPGNRPVGVSWGDSRYANFMFDGLTCVALLDWEDVSLSSPLFDLGRWLVTDALHEAWDLPRLEGLGGRDETLALWQICSGLSTADLRWYEAFGLASAYGIAARSMRLQSAKVGAAPSGFTPKTLESLLLKLGL